MTDQPETRMVAVDGTDALAYVILRPGSNASGVVIEAAAKGISKPYAAYALRHTAQSWDPDDTVGTDVGEQLKEALAEVEQLRAGLAQARTAALNEGAAALDRIAEQAEAKVLAHYGGQVGHGSCDMVREAARTLRDMAASDPAPACSCRAEAVHQAGCDTDQHA